MSPEERAAKILREYRHEIGVPVVNSLFLGRAIAAAVRESVEEERERMALKCEQLTARRAAEMGLAFHDHLTGYQCAQAIRDHGTSSIEA